MAEFFGIILGTFVAEDIALASALYLVSIEKLSLVAAFLACSLGIAIGDVALFFLGRLIARYWSSSKNRFVQPILRRHKSTAPRRFGATVIFASRFVPGTRLPTYVGAGLTQYSLNSFLILTVTSVLAWVGMSFSVAGGLFQLANGYLYLAVPGFFLALALLRWGILGVVNPWQRKAYRFSWSKYAYFEFWPSWAFYPPVLVWYVWLSIRYRNPFLPLYSNPSILNGGLIGESKGEIYDSLRNANPAFLLKTKLVVYSPTQEKEVRKLVEDQQFQFPLVLKPDKGQRGYGVKVIRSFEELDQYFCRFNFDLLVQEYCVWKHEAGIFYYRMPDEKKGRIFSITDKTLPEVVGDGQTTLGDLILSDPRARLIAMTYFKELGGRENDVPPAGHRILLTETGNHCKGAIFSNHAALSTAALLATIEEIFESIPGFFIGRLDVRYESAEALREGRNFKIVELNGAGSEATHIWDRNTGLFEAYRVLFQQWDILFRVGEIVREKGIGRPVSLFQLIRDYFAFVAT